MESKNKEEINRETPNTLREEHKIKFSDGGVGGRAPGGRGGCWVTHGSGHPSTSSSPSAWIHPPASTLLPAPLPAAAAAAEEASVRGSCLPPKPAPALEPTVGGCGKGGALTLAHVTRSCTKKVRNNNNKAFFSPPSLGTLAPGHDTGSLLGWRWWGEQAHTHLHTHTLQTPACPPAPGRIGIILARSTVSQTVIPASSEGTSASQSLELHCEILIASFFPSSSYSSTLP